MTNVSASPDFKIPALLFFLVSSLCFGSSKPLDTSRYIGIDEIRPGMDSYCLTVYEGTNVERFDLEIVSVIRDFMPGRNLILVKGTDERFIYSDINFILLGEMIPLNIGKSKNKTYFLSLVSIFSRYILLAIPLIIAVKFDQYNLISVVIGIFMVQFFILAEHVFINFSSNHRKQD